MGSTNYGNQTISFNYMENAKGQDFNILNYKSFSRFLLILMHVT